MDIIIGGGALVLMHTFLYRVRMPSVERQASQEEQAMEFHLTSYVRGLSEIKTWGSYSAVKGNSEDPYAVAVISDGNIYVVGHIQLPAHFLLLQELSKTHHDHKTAGNGAS